VILVGEILIRGPSVTKGYFKRPEINAETFTEDGWLKTGDIGQWNADGTLSIIDRYVAPMHSIIIRPG